MDVTNPERRLFWQQFGPLNVRYISLPQHPLLAPGSEAHQSTHGSHKTNFNALLQRGDTIMS